jgi:hypothetical protein
MTTEVTRYECHPDGYPVKVTGGSLVAFSDYVALKNAALRAVGEHHAPNDCYATGPLTGDPIQDLMACPACQLLALLKVTP